jgi:ubiquinone/menaquinone biosynthesis C-methylase UbiE
VLHFKSFSFDRVSKTELLKFAKDAVNPQRIEEQIAVLEKVANIKISGKTLLEIGSGYGTFVAITRCKHKSSSYGIEPDLAAYNISLKILKCYQVPEEIIHHGYGEDLPYPDNYFDIVYSTNVLEHVNDPKKVIHETIRVLKPGGYFQFVIPNYGSFWEGHYGILWIPNIPKWIAKIYVSLYGRDPKFIDTLQFINYQKLKSILSKYNNIRIIDWGEEIWEERLIKMNFSEWAELGKLKKMVEFAHRLRIINLIRLAGRIFKFHTPIILTAKKTG